VQRRFSRGCTAGSDAITSIWPIGSLPQTIGTKAPIAGEEQHRAEKDRRRAGMQRHENGTRPPADRSPFAGEYEQRPFCHVMVSCSLGEK
jgi:hypothetical protein